MWGTGPLDNSEATLMMGLWESLSEPAVRGLARGAAQQDRDLYLAVRAYAALAVDRWHITGSFPLALAGPLQVALHRMRQDRRWLAAFGDPAAMWDQITGEIQAIRRAVDL